MATTLFPLQYLRQGALPIDVDSVFQTTAERLAYLANGRRYPGQVVADNEDNKVYVLNSTGDAWIELGSSGAIPAGNTGDVQWNNSGSMGADSGFTFDESTASVGLSKLANSTSTDVQVQVDLGPKAWYVKYGDGSAGASNEYPSSVARDLDGNIYTVGTNYPTNAFIIKLSKEGQLLWQKDIGEPEASFMYGEAIAVADDGSIYTGIRISNGIAIPDYQITILLKLDSSGSLLWSRELKYVPPTYSYQGIGIVDIQAVGGFVYCLIRYSDVNPATTKTALCKYDSNGGPIWEYSISDSNSSSYIPKGLHVDSAGNSYISTQLYGLVYYATAILKIDSSGSLVWNTAIDVNPTFPPPASLSSPNLLVGLPPVTDFIGTPLTGVAPLTVNFTDLSTNAPTSWEWDFDNSGSVDSTDQNPTHTYATPGTYSVKLTTTNGDGSDTVTKIDYVTASPIYTIFYDDFSGSAGTLTGHDPNTTPATATWVSSYSDSHWELSGASSAGTITVTGGINYPAYITSPSFDLLNVIEINIKVDIPLYAAFTISIDGGNLDNPDQYRDEFSFEIFRGVNNTVYDPNFVRVNARYETNYDSGNVVYATGDVSYDINTFSPTSTTIISAKILNFNTLEYRVNGYIVATFSINLINGYMNFGIGTYDGAGITIRSVGGEPGSPLPVGTQLLVDYIEILGSDAVMPLPAFPLAVPTYLHCVPEAGMTNVVNNVAWYCITTTRVINLTITTEGSTTGIDTEVGLYDANGDLLDSDDDGGTGYLSWLTYYELPPGTYFIAAGYYNIVWGATGFDAVGDTPLLDDCQIKLTIVATAANYSSVLSQDTSGNTYAALPGEFAEDGLMFSKLDPAGNILWCSKLTGPSWFTPTGIAVDTDGSIFLSSVAMGDLHISKWNSSGGLEWQRLFSGPGVDSTAYVNWGVKNLSLDGECYVIVGNTSMPPYTTGEGLVVRLPKNGGITGSYGDFTYSGTSYIPSTITPEIVTGNPVVDTRSFTDGSSSITVTNGSKISAYTYMFGGPASWIFSSNGDLNFNDWTLTGLDGGVGGVLQTDGTGSSSWTPYYLPLADGSTGNILITDGSGAVTWQIGGDVAGINDSVQFNDGGSFGGQSGFEFSNATSTLTTENLNVTTELTVGYATNSSSPGNITVEYNQPPGRCWVNQIGASNAYPKAIKFDNSGQNVYAVMGLFTTYGDTLIKFNTGQFNIYNAGNIEWKVDLNLAVYDLCVNSFNEIFVIGTRLSTDSIYILKISILGTIEWQHEIPSTLSAYSTLTLYNAGADIVIAYSDNPVVGITKTLYVRKIDRFSNTLWQISSDISSFLPDMECSNIITEISGNIILSLISSGTGSTTYPDIGLMKFNSAGTLLWAKKYSAPSNRIGGHTVLIEVDSVGNIYWGATEYFSTPVPYNGLYQTTGSTIVYGKCDSSGNLLWQRRIKKLYPISNTELTNRPPPWYIYGLALRTFNGNPYLNLLGQGLDYYGKPAIVIIDGFFVGTTPDDYLDPGAISGSTGAIYTGTGTDQEEGNLIAFHQNSGLTAVVGKSILTGTETGNNIYEAGFVAVYDGGFSISGYNYDSTGGTLFAESFTLNTTTVTPVFTNTSITSSVTTGTLYPVTLVNNLYRQNHPVWQFGENGKTNIAMEYILPATSAKPGQVLTMGDKGVTYWATPAVESRSTEYSWTGTQYFIGKGLKTSLLLQGAHSFALSASGTENVYLNINTDTAVYYTLPASGNWSTSFAGIFINPNETVKYWALVTQGSTAYYNKDIWINGEIVTNVEWLTERPLAGNPNSIDIYEYNVTRLTYSPVTYKVTAARYKYVPQPPDTYWLTQGPDPVNITFSYVANSPQYDSSGNVLVVGSKSNFLFVAKFNPNGEFQWGWTLQSSYWFTTTTTSWASTAVDTSNNFVVLAYNPTIDKTLLLKIDSSGAIVWQRHLDNRYTSVACDSTDNIYICSNEDNVLIKYDSAGNMVLEVAFDTVLYLKSVAVDSSGNIYLAGNRYFLKLNSSGAIQWQKWSPTTNGDFMRITLSSSGLAYITNTEGHIFTVDTSTGNLTALRKFTGLYATFDRLLSIDVDSSGNIYYALAATNTFYGKIDNAGTVLWENSLTANIVGLNSGRSEFYGIKFSSNSIYTAGQFYAFPNSNAQNFFAAKLPADGSGINYYRRMTSHWSFNIAAKTPTGYTAQPQYWFNGAIIATVVTYITDTTPTLTPTAMDGSNFYTMEILPTF